MRRLMLRLICWLFSHAEVRRTHWIKEYDRDGKSARNAKFCDTTCERCGKLIHREILW